MEGRRISDTKKIPRSSLISDKTIELTITGNSNMGDDLSSLAQSIFVNNEKSDTNEPDTKNELQNEEIESKLNKEEIGRELKENNEKIVDYILCLRQHRNELIHIIEKQYKERKKLENEMERITYKLCLINKSMAQRIKTKNLYDETIKEIECNYCHLIKDSEKILELIKSRYDKLESMISKKTSTDEIVCNMSKDEQASGEGTKAFKCPPLKSTLNKIANKRSSTSNDSLT